MTMTNEATHEDHTRKCEPVDPMQVNLNEEHELIYWTERFEVSPAELRVAVHAVGNDATAVSKALGLSR
jgi:hypothetical protein